MIKDQQGREIYVETEDGQHRPATANEYHRACLIRAMRKNLVIKIADAQRDLETLNEKHKDNKVFYDDHGNPSTLRHFFAAGRVDLI